MCGCDGKTGYVCLYHRREREGAERAQQRWSAHARTCSPCRTEEGGGPFGLCRQGLRLALAASESLYTMKAP